MRYFFQAINLKENFTVSSLGKHSLRQNAGPMNQFRPYAVRIRETYTPVL